jgi:hypothetical protein
LLRGARNRPPRGVEREAPPSEQELLVLSAERLPRRRFEQFLLTAAFHRHRIALSGPAE